MAGNITGKEEIMAFQCKRCPAMVEFPKGFEPYLHLCQDCHHKALADFWRIFEKARG